MENTVAARRFVSANFPACLMGSESRTFVKGVLSAADVQAPDPAFLGGACEDRSRFAGSGAASGPRLTVRGIGTGIYGSLQYLRDATGSQRSGLPAFSPS